MLVKDQIRVRREDLGMTMRELGDRVGVTEQAVRHWEGGRSFPGKSKMRLVERALSFVIDWTEGASTPSEIRSSASMIDPADVELLLLLARLPAAMKGLLSQVAQVHLAAVDSARAAPGSRLSETALRLPPAPPMVRAPEPAPAPAAKSKTKA